MRLSLQSIIKILCPAYFFFFACCFQGWVAAHRLPKWMCETLQWDEMRDLQGLIAKEDQRQPGIIEAIRITILLHVNCILWNILHTLIHFFFYCSCQVPNFVCNLTGIEESCKTVFMQGKTVFRDASFQAKAWIQALAIYFQAICFIFCVQIENF